MTQANSESPSRVPVPAWRHPLVTTLLLTIPSFFLVAKAAGDEPFCCYNSYDAFLFGGVGSIALVVWWLNLFYIATLFVTHRQRLALVLPVLLTLFALLHVWNVPFGYFDDLDRATCSEAGKCLGFRTSQ